MTAEHEALAVELRQARLEASDVLHNLASGVLTVDADGKLLFANPAAEQILAFRAKDWLGRAFLPELAQDQPGVLGRGGRHRPPRHPAHARRSHRAP